MDTAHFLIGQYFRDPIRREPKNVGLFIVKGDECAARFLGEDVLDSHLDLRTVRWAQEPEIYKKWVRFWRDELAAGTAGLLKRVEARGGNYNVIFGGKATETNGDSALEICENLFPILVGDANTEEEERKARESQQEDLRKTVKGEFESLGILGGRVRDPARNPVWSRATVPGKRAPHVPSFLQRAPRESWVMEVVNFTTTRKVMAKNHASFVAKMFDDIHSYPSNANMNRAAIVRGSAADMQDKTVKYALALLTDSVDKIVNWEDTGARAQFLEARREAAYDPSFA